MLDVTRLLNMLSFRSEGWGEKEEYLDIRLSLAIPFGKQKESFSNINRGFVV